MTSDEGSGPGPPAARKGRGVTGNADGRYEPYRHVRVDDGWGGEEEDVPRLGTTVLPDRSRTVIARNDSPDVPFDQSVNPYRGCEHGCAYCYARPSHAWLGMSPGLDFESRILAKPDAPRLLERELSRPDYRCRVLAMGTNTDPYQPVERRLGITRGILELLQRLEHPVTITTKGALVLRDLDLLAPMAALGLASVLVSVTTLDAGLSRRLEPRAAAPGRRLECIRRLADAGIPVGVLVAPVIPALNDAEIERILGACREAGALSAAYILLRLPLEVGPLFEQWLQDHEPLRAGHVMSLVRQCRDGASYDSAFGRRMRGTGRFAGLLEERFRLASRRLGFAPRMPDLDTSRFRSPAGEQMSLL